MSTCNTEELHKFLPGTGMGIHRYIIVANDGIPLRMSASTYRSK